MEKKKREIERDEERRRVIEVETEIILLDTQYYAFKESC